MENTFSVILLHRNIFQAVSKQKPVLEFIEIWP